MHRLLSPWPLRARAVPVAVSLLTLGAGAASAQLPSRPLTGTWIGVYQSYPVFVQMTLEMGPGTEAGQTAQLRLESISAKQPGGPRGIATVSVRYEPEAGTIEIVPGADASRSLGGPVPRFSGVLDRERQVFGGVLVPARSDASPYFILGQKGMGEDGFLEPIRKAAESKPSGMGGFNLLRGGGDGDKITAWAAKLLEEYPDMDPYRTEMGQVFLRARSLFADEHFETHFGKTFDKMSSGDLTKVFMAIEKLPAPRSNLPEERLAGAARAVERGFQPMVGTYTASDITLSVLARRPMAAWRTAALTRLASLGASATALDAVLAVEAAEGEVLDTFWPSDRMAFAAAVGTARTRVAGPTLTAKVTEAMAAARGLDGARQLAALLTAQPTVRTPPPPSAVAARTGRRGADPRMPAAGRSPVPAQVQSPAGTDVASLLAMVSPDAAAAERTRINGRIDELLAEQVAADRAALGQLGSGPAALEAGVVWYANVGARYGELAGRPAVQALFGELATRRAADLRASEAAVTGQVQAAASSAEVSRILGRTVGVPSDRNDPVGARLLSLGQSRSGDLAGAERVQQAARAEVARQERSVCSRASTEAGETQGEPTEKDLCDAMEASFRGIDRNLENMKQSSCGNASKNDPMAAMMCLVTGAAGAGGGPQLSLAGFEKVACVSAAPSGKPGFICDMIAKMQTGNAMTRSMFEAVGASVTTRRFVRRSGRWMVMPPDER